MAWGLWRKGLNRRSPAPQQHYQLSTWKPENCGFAPQAPDCVEKASVTSCTPEGIWLYLSLPPLLFSCRGDPRRGLLC